MTKMKKNNIFTFTAPNGEEVTAVAIDCISNESNSIGCTNIWLCYSQNRLFTYIIEQHDFTGFGKCDVASSAKYGKVLVDYAILPDYDELLARYNDIKVAQAETSIEI